MNGEKCKETISSKFGEIREKLNQRENELIEEVDETKNQKKKEILIQKDDLEIISQGIKSASEITETLLKKGTNVEIGVSKKQVIARLETLQNLSYSLDPIQDSHFQFNFSSNFDLLIGFIKEFGSVFSQEYQISSKNSLIDDTGFNKEVATINKPISFKIISIDSNGKRSQPLIQDSPLPFEIEIKTPDGSHIQV